MSWCPHDDDPYLCPACNRQPKAAQAGLVTARFHGTCQACDDAIHPGDPILQERDEHWIHAGCFD